MKQRIIYNNRFLYSDIKRLTLLAWGVATRGTDSRPLFIKISIRQTAVSKSQKKEDSKSVLFFYT
jgi:hypothetical protein